MRIKRVALKHHGEAPLGRRFGRDISTIDAQGAPADIFQPTNHPQQGRLATARGAHEHDELTIFDLKVDPLDDLRLAEPLFDTVKIDRTHHFAPADGEAHASQTAAVHVKVPPPAGAPVSGSKYSAKPC